MDILLLEDDPLVAELIELVLGNLVPHAQVQHCSTLAAAKASWQPSMQLLICDRQLTDGSGLDLVKLVRSQAPELPIVMISAHSDREAVIAAARCGVSEFIAKPLNLSMLQQRLEPLLARLIQQQSQADLTVCLSSWLSQTLTGKLTLPSELALEAVWPLLEKSAELSAQDLARAWQNEIPLTARLLHLANGASLKRSGQPISRVDEAISTLGIDMALAAAMALALDIRGSLQDPRLLEQAQFYHTTAEQVASLARAMTMSVGLSSASCYTAGLLSRVGELAVLRALQDFINQGGKLADEQLPLAIAEWSPNYGNRLKIQWGLPLPTRELIGAIHQAPTHATQRPLLIMHLAALRVASRLDTPEALRMLRQAGLEVEKWWPKANDTAPPDQPILTTPSLSSDH
ncbi:HDOD domain-containing protein [Oceanisphaera sp. W20_SRM_FM3]|uniref:HDOD domain-containing protein n=1 Tax=Oceanisphaera sp. W20_SRM_FM3 TaxID=3240267 RepID=UPI003F9DC117